MSAQERQKLDAVVVTAEEMSQIEAQIFAKGMPVAALMEKAALLSARAISKLYPGGSVGVLVGPGHNGGDALVIARELWLEGYRVQIYAPFSGCKELTQQHANYAQSLGIPWVGDLDALQNCDFLVDGLFGFGLTRPLEGAIAQRIEQLNEWEKPVVSVDLPSGIHTDTGEVLGVAVKATHTLCLGLWKRAFFQDRALPFLGEVQRLDVGIPPAWLRGATAPVLKMTGAIAKSILPLPRSALTHKYQQGHLLLVCGSERHAGSAILTALGARSSGVGMLSVAVPASLKPLLVSHLPEALIVACPETPQGAIASLPPTLGDWSSYSAIAAGPGLTLAAEPILRELIYAPTPLVVDADALSCLANIGLAYLANRPAATVLTPHLGEFRRLFRDIIHSEGDRLQAALLAAHLSGAIVLLKGARSAIASPQGTLWLIGESTPALAKGGSGDVLTGLIGGWLAQKPLSTKEVDLVATAAWCHAQAGILAAHERSELGVDGATLAQAIFAICNKLFPRGAMIEQSSG